MTAPLPPPDDELVSAHLDGETTAEDAARIAADPALAARLAELEAVHAQVAAPVDVPPAAREAALAAALDVFDREVAPGASTSSAPTAVSAPFGSAPANVPPPAGWGSTDPPPVPGDELAARRATRRPGWLLGAAAAVVVLLAIVGVSRLATRGSDSTTTAADLATPKTAATSPAADAADGAPPSTSQESSSATAADQQPVTPPTSAPSAAAPTTAVSRAPSTTAPATSQADGATPLPATGGGLPDLGTIGSASDLARAVDGAAQGAGGSSGGDSTKYGGSPAMACDAARRAADPELGALTLVGEATYQGRPVYVLSYTIDRQLYPNANGTSRTYAVDRTTCAVVEAITR